MAETRRMNWALVRNSYTRKNENNQTTLPFIKLPFLDLKFFINFWEYHESKLSLKRSGVFSSCRVLTQTYRVLFSLKGISETRDFFINALRNGTF